MGLLHIHWFKVTEESKRILSDIAVLRPGYMRVEEACRCGKKRWRKVTDKDIRRGIVEHDKRFER